ncbi:beta-1,3-galactosyl-O-glycosyl-glycoprotein beta-1,6-N-acetylglucosaminyltransferase-like isoform X2 [Dreissena polymorpha]|uniref:beta-1,3-galactosyl-O-glycosyl-glycoprotein beta-1,6-N-acetylglucosaminyltransferase-like isoform X2 n=1 Tax=Dreissena polymorpha TaxID=45954 RepID=UPI002263C3BA|nr:beta-1,3-galactosyl-O-glycosyl-glycoprotein beta-1,6-N-acetylglucosaminyltransferase-like isoform X2 [Dreissena polymorpha]
MYHSTRYMILFGIIVFLGTCMYVLDFTFKQENNIHLQHKHYFHYSRMDNDVNCNAIFQGDIDEIQRAEKIIQVRNVLQPKKYSEMTKNCSHFKRLRGYIDHHLTEVERDFPIAFSLLIYTDIEQSERLLRAIYRPQNFYCIHVDSKTDEAIYVGMSSIASCFDNVFMTSKRFNVRWGTMTVLEPELLCMQELWNKSAEWKYFINLTGQEFPLKTNYELVRILQAYNGSNDIEGTFKRASTDRWQRNGAPPHNITAIKGSVHIVANRGFVDFILHDQRAHDLLNWTRQTEVPDETFFSTLNHNPHLGVPGAYLDNMHRLRMALLRYDDELDKAEDKIEDNNGEHVEDIKRLYEGVKQIFRLDVEMIRVKRMVDRDV